MENAFGGAFAGSMSNQPGIPAQLTGGSSGGIVALNTGLPLLQNPVGVPAPGPAVPLMAIWSVPAPVRAQSDQIFLTIDLDQDGLVNGAECRNLFLQSGLSAQVLAQIWALCDIKKNGLLNSEQFALSFFLIQQKVRQNIDPPPTLPPDMVPHSLRTYQTQFPMPGVTLPDGLDDEEGGDEELKKEIKKLEQEIETIRKEKRQLFEEVEGKKSDIQKRQEELQNMSREVDTLHAAAKQLDLQRMEAQKRLDDLDAQKQRAQSVVSTLVAELDSERQRLIVAKDELERRQSGAKSQEEEVRQKRAELQRVKQEEQAINTKIDQQSLQLRALEAALMEGDARIAQIEEAVARAERLNAILKDGITQFDAALDTQDISGVKPEYLSTPVSELTFQSGYINFEPINTTATPVPQFFPTAVHAVEDPFAGEDPFSKPASGSFSEDPWGASPFKAADPFAGGGFPPESPTPALPPKKISAPVAQIPQNNTGNRQPPPRPAPPKAGSKKKDISPAKDAFDGDPWGTASADASNNSYAFPAFDQPASSSSTFATDFGQF